MRDYAVMHLDRHVATVRGDGSCTVYYPQFMPYNLYLEKADDLSGRMNNLSNFHYWCATRLITMDRKYAKEILNSLGMKQAVTDRERAEIAISYHALCLTDVFWVRELRENVRENEYQVEIGDDGKAVYGNIDHAKRHSEFVREVCSVSRAFQELAVFPQSLGMQAKTDDKRDTEEDQKEDVHKSAIGIRQRKIVGIVDLDVGGRFYAEGVIHEGVYEYAEQSDGKTCFI